MMIPSAQFSEAGTLAFTFSDSNLFRFGTIVTNPFNWFEASYFYVSVQDTPYSTNNSYLDKGFNAKFRLWKDSYLFDWTPDIAFGLRDLAGTGLSTGEYLVATKAFDYFNFTVGLGWGSFLATDDNQIDNPFTFLHERFETRYKGYGGIGGVLNTDSWFTGPASLFYGLEIHIPYGKGLKLKVAKDPMDYTENYIPENIYDAELRYRKSDYDYGLTYNISNSFEISASYERGQDLNFNIVFKPNFSKKLFRAPKKDPYIEKPKTNSKEDFYLALLKNLNSNNLYLQSAELKENSINVDIAQATYYNKPEAAREAAKIVLDTGLDKDVDYISINEFNGSFQTSNLTFERFTLEKFNKNDSSLDELYMYTTFENPKNNIKPLRKEFTPKVLFPNISFGTGLGFRHHVGTPENFWNGNLFWRADLDIQFNRKLYFTSSHSYSFQDTYDRLDRDGNSALPPVRTYVRNYLQEQRGKVALTQALLVYKTKLYNDFYGRLVGGIYEDMFAGHGYELLWKPYTRDFAIGWNHHEVRQRGFDGKYDSYLDYETDFKKLTLYYYEPNTGININIHTAEYLAGDKGNTFEIYKRFLNGFSVGAFWSRSNISYDQFGEGSFDKGIFFQIPLDYFFSYNRMGFINFSIRPLTRDGQQMLVDSSEIYGDLTHHHRKLLREQWYE